MNSSSRERFYRKVQEMHRLWNLATADLTVEQVNYRERDGVLPIAFTLLHYVRGEDRLFCETVLKTKTIWEGGNWQERVGGNPLDIRRGAQIEEAETATIGNIGAWDHYQQDVFTHTETILGSWSDEDFDKPIFDRLPDPLRGSFLEAMVGEGENVPLITLLEAFAFQHGMRHLGELEHARSLIGLRGLS